MDRVRVLKELNEIFCDNFDDDTIVLSEETNANDIEDWDSLEQINLLTTIEKKYNIKFKLSDVKNLENVGDLLDVLDRFEVE